MEESISKLHKQIEFSKKYHELFQSLIRLSKEAAIVDIIIKEITLPQRWYIRYPDLQKDLIEQGLYDKILGFNINI